MTKLVGDEAAYASSYGGINQEFLERHVATRNCADNYILSFEGPSQGGKIECSSRSLVCKSALRIALERELFYVRY